MKGKACLTTYSTASCVAKRFVLYKMIHITAKKIILSQHLQIINKAELIDKIIILAHFFHFNSLSL